MFLIFQNNIKILKNLQTNKEKIHKTKIKIQNKQLYNLLIIIKLIMNIVSYQIIMQNFWA